MRTSGRSVWDGLTDDERADLFDSWADDAYRGMRSHGVCTCRRCEAWMCVESVYRCRAAELREGDGRADSG